jgi:hypothetical protein
MCGNEINQIQNDRKDSNCTGVSTFAIRKSQCTGRKLQKSFHLATPRKNSKIFFPTLRKKIKHPTHKPDKKALDK